MRAEQPSLGHKEAFSLAVAGWSLLSSTEKGAWAPEKSTANGAAKDQDEDQNGPAAEKMAVESPDVSPIAARADGA